MSYDALKKEFPQSTIKQVNKGGTSLDYVPIAEVINRLNVVLGVDAWGEQDTQVWRDGEYGDWVLARTTVWVRDSKGQVSTKTGYGGQKIKMKKDGSGPVDLGDEYKGAHSDAFKKACTKLGVALHLARDEAAVYNDVYDERDLAPHADEAVVKVLVEAIEALDDEQKEALREKFKQERIPKITGDSFTVEHAKIAATLLGVNLP